MAPIAEAAAARLEGIREIAGTPVVSAWQLWPKAAAPGTEGK